MIKTLSVILLVFMVGGCISTQPPQPPQQRTYNQPKNSPYDIDLFEDEDKLFVLGSLSKTALGQNIGEYITKMRDKDKTQLARVFENQQMGMTKRWFNEENETVFAVTPTRQHQYSDGSFCKEYSIETQQHNDIKEYYGRACKKDDSWVIVN